MVLIMLLKRRTLSKCILRLVPLIEQRDWDGMNEIIDGIITEKYNEVNKKNKNERGLFLYREKKTITMNLSRVLNLLLASNPPYRTVKRVLKIDPELSSLLVLMPDVLGNLPIQYGWKVWVHPDIIKLLLHYDKTRYTFGLKCSSTKNLNALHYAILSALCPYQNEQEHPAIDSFLDCYCNYQQMTMQYGDFQQHDDTTNNKGGGPSNLPHVEKLTKRQKQQYRRRQPILLPQQQQQQQQQQQDCCPQKCERRRNTSIPSHKIYVACVNLIKYLIRHSPELMYFQDVFGCTALDIVRCIRAKTKRRKHNKEQQDSSNPTSTTIPTSPPTKEEKVYCKRVDYVYKILRREMRRTQAKLIGFLESDDTQSQSAQCGISTAWSVQLFEDQEEDAFLLSSPKRFMFVHRSKTEIV
jgi:hypothetical protein